jgi:5'-nucleotidase
MNILITNDDGIYAQGLKVLKEVLSAKHEVFTVAPLNQQSAVSNHITIFDPVRTYKTGENNYAIDGTPVDCVRLALDVFYKKNKPDVVISGINPGINTGHNILYSGTVAAAMEAYVSNIPGLAVSIDGFEKLDYKYAAGFVLKTTEQIGTGGFMPCALNINIPNISPKKIKGIKITRQGRGAFKQSYHQRTDPRKNKYFWPDGKMAGNDTDKKSDYHAVKKGYISITPLTWNLTDEVAMENMQAVASNIENKIKF